VTRRRQFGSIRRLPSGRWQARYRDRTGEQHTAVYPTKSDAGRWLSAAEADMARGDWINPRLGRVTIGEWAEEWLRTTVHLKPKTRASYESILRTHLLPRFASVPIARVEQVDIRRFMAELSANGAAPGTVRNAYRVLRLVLGAAVGSGSLRANPADGLKLPRSERGSMVFLTARQVCDLADAIGSPYDVLVTFAAYTGLRAGEIAGLRVGRINLLRRTVDVVETIGEADGRLVTGSTKTYERRTVPLSPFLVDVLAGHVAPRASDPEALAFTSPEGGPLRHGNFYRRHFRPAVVAAGLPAHTCAALLIANGGHPKAIAELLGHSSITVTLDRYGHLFPSIAEALAEGLDATYRAAMAERRQLATVTSLH
jgi:integrase